MSTHRLPGLLVRDHELELPLDHAAPDGERIRVYAREVVKPSRERDDLPWLLYLQGGPGGKSPRPAERGAWLGRALDDFRVLLLDQRGTGRSTPANRQSLAARGDAAAQAAYLEHFRADAIVRDAEAFRLRVAGGKPWTILGQSYGGFCALTYLSFAPEGLRSALIAGGLAAVARPIDDVYTATYAQMLRRNARYYERYPDDERRAAELVEHIAAAGALLLSGDPLTPERFQQLGWWFGMRDGFERVHYLLEEAWVDGPGGRELSDTFLAGVADVTTFTTGPLYAVLHESIYCQGEASRWSAQRLRGRYPDLDPGARPLRFTGEMVYPWMFEVDASLRPLAEAAELLARKEDWPALYDVGRLRANEVPCAAVVYHDDPYVAASLSLETADLVRGLRVWVTNEHEHDGLGRAGDRVLGRLLDLARGDA